MTSAAGKPKKTTTAKSATSPATPSKRSKFASPKQAKMARYVLDKYEKALRDLAK